MKVKAEAGKYGENKEQTMLMLTPTAKKILRDNAKLSRLSASEFVEQWLRNRSAAELTIDPELSRLRMGEP